MNYLNIPVCPNCGSPNLHETDTDGEITNCWCDRCGTRCWFDSSFDTETGADHVRYRIGESAKKMQTKPQTFSEMVAKQRAKNNNPLMKSRVDLGVKKMPKEEFLYDSVMRNIPDFAYSNGILNCTPYTLKYIGKESTEMVDGFNRAIYEGSTTYEGFKGGDNLQLKLKVSMDMMSGEYTAEVSTDNPNVAPAVVSTQGTVSGVNSKSVASDFQIIDAIETALGEFDNTVKWIW